MITNNSQYYATVPVRLEWKGDGGAQMFADGLTENIGLGRVLVYFPRTILPLVGVKVLLTVTDVELGTEVKATTVVVRLDRNPRHPLVSLQLKDSLREWKKEVFDLYKLYENEKEQSYY
ncbi:MAG TPA: hypothetical protein VF692_07620 [Pyrinomonadaceae bacterium]